MRGSSFAEKRVIDLINSRFVAFYFCFREGRIGSDPDAAAVYNPALKDDEDFKTGIPPAVVFSPGGHQALKKIPRSIHFEKDRFYDALIEALRENPAYDAPSPEERRLLAGASTPEGKYRAARAREMAGAANARELYGRAIAADPSGPWASRARLRLATLDRYARAWDRAEELLAAVQGPDLADDVAMERGHRLLAERKDAEALKLLDTTIRAHPGSNRMGELRFYAGAANWRLDRKDWANYHWWWVLEHLPEDHHVVRCSVALTAPANCFANPELDGYAGKAEMTINEGINQRESAKGDYEKLKDKY